MHQQYCSCACGDDNIFFRIRFVVHVAMFPSFFLATCSPCRCCGLKLAVSAHFGPTNHSVWPNTDASFSLGQRPRAQICHLLLQQQHSIVVAGASPGWQREHGTKRPREVAGNTGAGQTQPKDTARFAAAARPPRRRAQQSARLLDQRLLEHEHSSSQPDCPNPLGSMLRRRKTSILFFFLLLLLLAGGGGGFPSGRRSRR